MKSIHERPDAAPSEEDSATAQEGKSSQARHEMIEACARLCQLLGVPRSIGQIYGLLYLAVKPQSLDDMVKLLGISKGSASTGTRQLSAWGAIRQVWVPGERRDYYETVTDLAEFIRGSHTNFVKPRVVASGRRLDVILASLDEDHKQGLITAGEFKVCYERVKSLVKLQKKIQGVLPIAEKLI
jgi:DNA-binding transcriptional regulator GbsR (MarR family)